MLADNCVPEHCRHSAGTLLPSAEVSLIVDLKVEEAHVATLRRPGSRIGGFPNPSGPHWAVIVGSGGRTLLSLSLISRVPLQHGAC